MSRRFGRDPGDFGENFVERERQFRFRKNNALSSRAKSEVAEVIGYKNGRSRDYVPSVPLDTSFQSDAPVYRRPKSSFEPASSSRILKNRSDDWCEVERRGIGNVSSEEEGNSDRDDDDSREEMLSYNFRPIETHSARHSNSYGHYHYNNRPAYGYRGNNGGRKSLVDFDKDEIYFFGVVQLSPDKAFQILSKNPPPTEYRLLKPIERAAYLYYFMLYRKYLTPVEAFRRVFNREFYKYVCDGDVEHVALWKICKHTHEEYKIKIQKRNQEAYNLSQKRLFSDERDSPDSRNSEQHSACDQESDLNSVDSISKEPLLYRAPHSTVSFAVGGRLVVLDPENSVSTVQIEDAKNFFLDRLSQRHIEALESFKGPLNKTRPQTALLFIERQIDRIRQSDVYRGNPSSGDANDCLLIWHLLEVLVRQQGKITGPDLARLLVADYSYSSFTAQSFVRGSSDRVYDSGSLSKDVAMKNEQELNMHAMDKFTQYLLGGHVEEAIDSAMHDGLLFDALFLAHRIYKDDPRKLNEVEEKLLRYRKPQHPVMTLMSVAAEMAVPLLTNTTTDDASGWRAHIAIVLANLQSPAAIETVYQLGLALAQKEFNSAADFCFLAVNLLNGNDSFRDPKKLSEKDEEVHRRHITLINASLPDDEFHSTHTRFGWSILDYQATEIFDYAQRLSYNSSGGESQMPATALSRSVEFQKCRLQYAKLLSECGGFNSNVFQYCTDIAYSIWGYTPELEPAFLTELCELADRFKYVANCDEQQCAWISCLQQYIPSAQTAVSATTTAMAALNVAPTTPIATTFLERGRGTSAVSTDTMDFNTAIDQTTSTNAPNNGAYNGSAKVSSGTVDFKVAGDQTTFNNAPSNGSYDGSAKVSSGTIDFNTAADQTTFDNSMGSGSYGGSAKVSSATVNYNIAADQTSFDNPMDSGTYGGGAVASISTPVVPIPSPPVPIPSPVFEEQYTPPPSSIQSDLGKYLPLADSNDEDWNHDVQKPRYSLTGNESKNSGGVTGIDSKSSGGIMGNDSKNSGGLMENDSKNSGGGGGLFSGLKSRLVKIIPTNSSMNLPDDKNPDIRWDEKLQRYVGDGVEDEFVPPPPPAMMAGGGGGGVGADPMALSSPEMPLQFGGGMPPIPEAPSSGPAAPAKKTVGGRALQRRYYNPGYFS